MRPTAPPLRLPLPPGVGPGAEGLAHVYIHTCVACSCRCAHIYMLDWKQACHCRHQCTSESSPAMFKIDTKNTTHMCLLITIIIIIIIIINQNDQTITTLIRVFTKKTWNIVHRPCCRVLHQSALGANVASVPCTSVLVLFSEGARSRANPMIRCCFCIRVVMLCVLVVCVLSCMCCLSYVFCSSITAGVGTAPRSPGR